MKIVLEFAADGSLVDLITRHSERLESFAPETRLNRLSTYQYQAPVYPGRVRLTVTGYPETGRIYRHVRGSGFFSRSGLIVGE